MSLFCILGVPAACWLCSYASAAEAYSERDRSVVIELDEADALDEG